MTQPLVQVKNLKKYFSVRNRVLKAVDNISINIFPNETLGLVGESGCGKTALARLLMGLYNPTSGNIFYKGKSIYSTLSKRRGTLFKEMQYIFQDPHGSLNPRMSAAEIISEPLSIHYPENKYDNYRKVIDLMNMVGLNEDYLTRYPHEFSGGQRQRIGIARALALNPNFIVCDEPIAALDVSIQAQVINLLKSLQSKMGLTYLFISHDLAMVKYLSTRVAVMYLGHIVEIGFSASLYSSPLHPYTQALLSAIPIPDPIVEKTRKRLFIKGEVPSPLTPPKGCVFNTRCPKATEKCFKVKPQLKKVSSGHKVACHVY